MTFIKNNIFTSHLVRSCLYSLLLPIAAIGYALLSRGPPITIGGACAFAGLVGFCTNLSMAECYSLILENFDTSDLQPGMTGRAPRQSNGERYKGQRTNFSCYPRVSAGIAVTQCLQYIFGAAATGLCGRLVRKLGARLATGSMAGALLVLTLLFTLVMARWRAVKMLPDRQFVAETLSRKDTKWEPVILGRPSGMKRKVSVLESSKLSRWEEIRRKNRVNTGFGLN